MRTNVPIACNLSALDEQEQQRRRHLASNLRDAVHEIVPASDGYTFRFAEVETDLREVAEFISLERRCCPFLEFKLEVGGANESITLRIRGRAAEAVGERHHGAAMHDAAAVLEILADRQFGLDAVGTDFEDPDPHEFRKGRLICRGLGGHGGPQVNDTGA